MKKQILIDVEAGERRIAFLEANKLDDYYVERAAQKSRVGNIYMAKVSSIVPAIDAAFVDYGAEKNGFLYFLDAIEGVSKYEEEDIIYNHSEEKKKRKKEQLKIADLLEKDQHIIVQVVKDEIGTKGARLTTNISLPGRYLVLMPNSKKRGISKRIRDEKERQRIKDILKEIKLSADMGLIARTAAEGGNRRDFLRDVKYLTRLWARIQKGTGAKEIPRMLHEELDLSSRIVRDMLTEQVEEVVIDDKYEFKKLRHLVADIAPLYKKMVSFYNEDVPLFERYGVEKEIDKIFQRKVYLKCGGYITVEQTEGMVSIDVNSGSFIKKKDPEEMVYKVNREAAEETARQLRLRDAGGIIIIDFIDMEDQKHRQHVFNILQQAFKKDKAKTHIVSFSELDIVEMTRQRTGKSLESASYQGCPYCNGRGNIMSEATVAIFALRKLKDFLKTSGRRRAPVEIIVHPDVAKRLREIDYKPLDDLKRRFRTKIIVLENPRFHFENIEIK